MDIHKLYAVAYLFDQLGFKGLVRHDAGKIERRPWRAIIKLTPEDYGVLRFQAWRELIEQGKLDDPNVIDPPHHFVYYGIRYEAMTDDEEAGVTTAEKNTRGT